MPTDRKLHNPALFVVCCVSPANTHAEQEVTTLKLLVEEKDAKIATLEDMILNLKKMPLGARERKRSIMSIETLTPQDGARKIRVTTTRWRILCPYV